MSKRIVITQLVYGFLGCLVVSLFVATPWTLRWWRQLGLSHVVCLVLMVLAWVIVIGGVRMVRKVRAR